MKYCKRRQCCVLSLFFIWLVCESGLEHKGEGGLMHCISPGMVHLTFLPFEVPQWLCLIDFIIWAQTAAGQRALWQESCTHPGTSQDTHGKARCLPWAVLHSPNRQYSSFEGLWTKCSMYSAKNPTIHY